MISAADELHLKVCTDVFRWELYLILLVKRGGWRLGLGKLEFVRMENAVGWLVVALYLISK